MDQQLLARAAGAGITVTMTADPETGDMSYTILEPDSDWAEHTSAPAAEADLTRRLERIDTAAAQAAQRAESWQAQRRNSAANIKAWNSLAAEVETLLPEGCSIPMINESDPYGISGLPPMTVCVAESLAEWEKTRRETLTRHQLEQAVKREGARLVESAEQLEHRPDYWGTVVELKRPVQTVRDIPDNAAIRRGMLTVEQDTRRSIAWRTYGIAVPLSRGQLQRSLEQAEQAQRIVHAVVERRRAEADQISNQLGVG